MDNFNRVSLRQAADVTETLTVSKDVVDRLKSYLYRKQDSKTHRISLKEVINEEEQQ
jgi:hypothetical protein